jgi:protein-S-isoprenylcysteine O-methyltransferase Ste14
MGLDIRLPIGMLFTLFGILLAFFGVFSNRALYAQSLGININLVWGLVLLVFGLTMLVLGARRMRRTRRRETAQEPGARPRF